MESTHTPWLEVPRIPRATEDTSELLPDPGPHQFGDLTVLSTSPWANEPTTAPMLSEKVRGKQKLKTLDVEHHQPKGERDVSNAGSKRARSPTRDRAEHAREKARKKRKVPPPQIPPSDIVNEAGSRHHDAVAKERPDERYRDAPPHCKVPSYWDTLSLYSIPTPPPIMMGADEGIPPLLLNDSPPKPASSRQTFAAINSAVGDGAGTFRDNVDAGAPAQAAPPRATPHGQSVPNGSSYACDGAYCVQCGELHNGLRSLFSTVEGLRRELRHMRDELGIVKTAVIPSQPVGGSQDGGIQSDTAQDSSFVNGQGPSTIRLPVDPSVPTMTTVIGDIDVQIARGRKVLLSIL